MKTGVNPIPRVASNARLADDGGTAGQLVLGFLIKGVILGVVVFMLGRFELPVEHRNFLYSESPSALHVMSGIPSSQKIAKTNMQEE